MASAATHQGWSRLSEGQRCRREWAMRPRPARQARKRARRLRSARCRRPTTGPKRVPTQGSCRRRRPAPRRPARCRAMARAKGSVPRPGAASANQVQPLLSTRPRRPTPPTRHPETSSALRTSGSPTGWPPAATGRGRRASCRRARRDRPAPSWRSGTTTLPAALPSPRVRFYCSPPSTTLPTAAPGAATPARGTAPVNCARPTTCERPRPRRRRAPSRAATPRSADGPAARAR